MMSMQNEEARGKLGKDMILDIIKTVIDMIIVFQRKDGKRQYWSICMRKNYTKELMAISVVRDFGEKI